MAERFNKIHIQSGVISYSCERWGGGQVWLEGLTHPAVVLARYRAFSGSVDDRQWGADGATLIDEDTKSFAIGVGIGDWNLYDSSHDFAQIGEGYLYDDYYNELTIYDCQIVRDCYVKLAEKVWIGWRVKIVDVGFAEKDKPIIDFDKLPMFPDNLRQNCHLTEKKIHHHCVTRFFKSQHFSLESIANLEHGQLPLPLESREVRIEHKQREWLEHYKEHGFSVTEEEVEERRQRFEAYEKDRELVYQTICEAYASILQEK